MWMMPLNLNINQIMMIYAVLYSLQTWVKVLRINPEFRILSLMILNEVDYIMGITVFKIFILGGISLDIRSEI